MSLAPAGTAADAADRRAGDAGAHRTPAAGASFEPYVVEAARATEALLDAIARSDGSRGWVMDHMRTPAFTATGDPAVGRVRRVRRPSASTHAERDVAGLVFERLIRVRCERAPRP